MCLPWQHWTKAVVWFDDFDISAFHICVFVDLWQSLSEWYLLLSACVCIMYVSCTYVYTRMYVGVYYAYTGTYVGMYYVCMYVCMYVRSYVCTCVCTCVCVCVCAWVFFF